MTSIYNTTVMDYYNFIFTDLADPRTKNWIFIGSPIPGLTLLASYLYFVLKWGPDYMKHRKPYQLNNVLIVYNFIQVCISSFIVYEGLQLWTHPKFSFKCQPFDDTWSEDAMREARDVHYYFLAKLTDLLDTVFFVLRKKDKQITFLHIYHHTTMPMISWGATKYYPGGHGTFIGIVNSFIHVIMYSYYLLAACGPKMQRFLWWKRYITIMQMIQFSVVFLHGIQLIWEPCNYPKFTLALVLPNAIFFFYLFKEFYVNSYKPKRGCSVSKKDDSDNACKENNNGAIKSQDEEIVPEIRKRFGEEYEEARRITENFDRVKDKEEGGETVKVNGVERFENIKNRS